MPHERGVVFLTVPKALADLVDDLSRRYELTTEQVLRFCVAIVVGELIEWNVEIHDRLRLVSEHAKREREAAALHLDRMVSS